MELGPPDESGRRRPVKKEGVLFDVETDSILTAIGEIPLFEYLGDSVTTESGLVVVDDELRADKVVGGKAKIFAGGDIINVPHTAVHAVSTGKKAAIAMDCDRKGSDFAQVLRDIGIGDGPAMSFSCYMGWAPVNPVKHNRRKVVDSEKIVYDYLRKVPSVEKEDQNAATRKASFNSYTKTFTAEEARREADRCIHCGRCIECDNCLVLCPDMSVLVRGNDLFGYNVDYDYCKGCGVCFTECPRYAITMVDEETPVEIES